MPSERSSEVKFEIGHVLFIDNVRYSKLLINEQSEQIQTLKEIVRGTEQFRLAEADPVWDPIRNDPGFQQLLTMKEHVGP